MFAEEPSSESVDAEPATLEAAAEAKRQAIEEEDGEGEKDLKTEDEKEWGEIVFLLNLTYYSI